LGIELYFTPFEYEGAANHGKLTVRLSGEPLAALTPQNKLNLLSELYLMNFEPSRIDLKVRDFDRLITPFEIDSIAKIHGLNDDICGFINLPSYQHSPSKRDKKRYCETLKLGSREGSKHLRIYDAFEKHGLECFDWEVELKQGKAKVASSKIMEHWIKTKDVESTYKMMADIVIGSVNFRHKTDKNIERCKEYGWWTEFKAGFDAIKISAQKVKTTIESTKKWLRKSVVNPLATVVFNGLGITTSEIKEKGFDTILKEQDKRVLQYMLGMLSEVELKSRHIDRLNAAETRAQATTSYSPIFQT
jgi:DNA relaxase NicK